MTRLGWWRVILFLLFAGTDTIRAKTPTTTIHTNTNIPLSRRRLFLRTWRQRIITTRRRWTFQHTHQQHQPSLSPMLSFRRPTTQSLSRHFFSSRGIPNSSMQAKFNHKTVGMTHPYFQSDWSKNQNPIETTTTVSSLSSSHHPGSDSSLSSALKENEDDEWWPSLLASPQHWRILKYRQTVGHGWDCYVQVRDAALQWDFATPHQGICTLLPPLDHNRNQHAQHAEIYHPLPAQSVHQISHGLGRRLMTYSRAPFFKFLFTLNPVQVIYDIVDQMEYPVIYTSTAYATSQSHLLQGEERVTVAFRERTGVVQVEVVSCSRPNGWKGRLVWPFLTQTQDRFFQQQMESLRRSAI